ncbi:MAG: two-component system sensor histidine kinase PhoQ [Polaribacter sp.]|jgi:two-component system sensor histidine kinase PhoQ
MILTAIALEKAVVKRALQAEEDKLQVMIYSLLAAVDQSLDGLSVTVANERLFESRLMTRDSGLYAILYNEHHEKIWGSLSSTESRVWKEFPRAKNTNVGEWQFSTQTFRKQYQFRLAFGILWPDANDQLKRYDVVLWQDASDYFRQLDRFRQTLWAWLSITIVLLLIVMYLVMMWSLRPLKKVGLEIKAIEDRKQTGFEQNYPTEITPLTDNLNILLSRERYQHQRYRNAMDDLAHSLKTPLAVLNGLTDNDSLGRAELVTMREQTARMNQIVSYQLQRATNVVGVKINKPIDLIVIIAKISTALEKVYLEKRVQFDSTLPSSILIRMDESDCYEVMGNLLDNAFKYCQDKVHINCIETNNDEIELNIEDNGSGLSSSEIDRILNRGARLDETSEGQGIGLAVVAEVVNSYNVNLRFEPSTLEGLKVVLALQVVSLS